MKIYPPKNSIELLKNLIAEDYKERKSIGEEMHGNKAYLNQLTMLMSKFEQSFENGKFDPVLIDTQKQLINDYLTESKLTRIKLYPPFLPLSGILVSLKQYIVDYQKTHAIEINLDFDEDKRDLFGEIKDIMIYKCCTEIINYLFLSKAKRLNIYFKVEANEFGFEIAARLNKNLEIKSKLKNNVDHIMAYLICSSGTVHETTNWKDRFCVNFKLKY